ncbi:MAG: signal peptide peptidase SppA [Gammaproteobacteria bacterium]|nr:signal peptide peptidase SppA [Gammaproteobacteria bacterium]
MIRVFKFLGRLIGGLIKAVQALFFLIFLVVVIAVVGGLGGAVVTVPDSAALIIAPSGVLVEQVEGEPLDQLLTRSQGGGQGQTVVRDVVESLRMAATDDRIEAVVLLPDGLAGGGLSKLQRIGAALDDFRASGKKVIAMGDGYDQAQYYLAAHADEVYMHDFGVVVIEGYAYFRAYFAEAIDKLSVDVNVFRVGEFKSFVEPYTRNTMSEEDKVAARRWLEALWSMWRRDVAAARGMTVASLDSYINGVVAALKATNGDAAAAAVNAGLIDGLKSNTEFRAYMATLVGAAEDTEDGYAHIDYATYLVAREFELRAEPEPEHQVAVLVASGNIVDGEAAPGTVGSATLARLIRQVANDSDIDALVLRIDSPGGSMFASEVILDELQALQAAGKPLVASMGSVAASGGYYIAMPADEIWAAESTISGSIGVGSIFPTFQRTLGAVGVTVDGFGLTELAGQFSGVQEISAETRELFEVSVESAYDLFVSKVAAAREMDPASVDEIARGRVWIGADALDIGLVDELGGIDEAVASAARLAGLQEGSWETVYVAEPMSVAEKLLLQYASLLQQLLGGAQLGGDGLWGRLLQARGVLESELQSLGAWNDPRGIYLHCFCDLR